MKIKITRCSRPDWWYSDKVGKTFAVVPENKRSAGGFSTVVFSPSVFFEVVINNASTGLVDKLDCVVITSCDEYRIKIRSLEAEVKSLRKSLEDYQTEKERLHAVIKELNKKIIKGGKS